MAKGLLKIRRVNDLSRLCIFPIVAISLLLSCYLYFDMSKIKTKAQLLVNSVVPTVLDTQQNIIDLHKLRAALELLVLSPDIEVAQQSYIDVNSLSRKLSSQEAFFDPEYSKELTLRANKIWRLRLQLDELRKALVSSFSYMDSILFLVYTSNPEDFPEFVNHKNEYVDLYHYNDVNKNLPQEHKFLYKAIRDRLEQQKQLLLENANIDPKTKAHIIFVIDNHIGKNRELVAQEIERVITQQHAKAFRKFEKETTEVLTSTDSVNKNDAVITQQIADSLQELESKSDGYKQDEQHLSNKNYYLDEAKHEKESSQNEQANFALNKLQQSNESSQKEQVDAILDKEESIIQQNEETLEEIFNKDLNNLDLEKQRAEDKSELPKLTDTKEVVNSIVNQEDNISKDISSSLDVNKIQKGLNKEMTHGLPNSYVYSSKELSYITDLERISDSLNLLNKYYGEYQRMLPMWSYFYKLHGLLLFESKELSQALGQINDIVVSNEGKRLHDDLLDISFLASEIQPITLITIAVCLIGLFSIIVIVNRYLVEPLKAISLLLVRFRYNKKVDQDFFLEISKKDNLLEIKEIIDVLPQIFKDYAQIEEQTKSLTKDYRELLANSRYDDLTKIYNRGSLNMLMKEIGSNTPARFAVLMIDIDFFKKLNDSMGHQQGDEVLFAVAQTLLQHISKKDMIYRYGGEEFCIILNDITQIEAYNIACRLCALIRSLSLINAGSESKIVTISVGVSLVTKSAKQFTIEELICQADRALYLAKNNGRDQAIVCPKDVAFTCSPSYVEAEQVILDKKNSMLDESEDLGANPFLFKNAEVSQKDFDAAAKNKLQNKILEEQAKKKAEKQDKTANAKDPKSKTNLGAKK